ncbi:MAG TPA: sigma-54 dependent transcriptional regulator [Hymenobacter sp.]|uniref:sigma-54-dependent transcriptional regulator n=1 Tax=Hymenobacter sp. TaxID=1898978 RepID=UPI002D7FABAA|nr:sigma-54 dependent transcriptional regulator [Hymenobacter sp.]HET9506234.1 sigma-54 dependent transcriptional regulator [Hymenobacter sp.]
MPDNTLLLIEDETHLRHLLARVLELEGYTVLQEGTAHRGLELLRQHATDVLVVLSDVKLPDGNGLALLPRYKAAAPLAEVILFTAYATVADGVQAMKAGAFDYLTKGGSDDQLLVVLERASEKARLQQRVQMLEKQVGQYFSFAAMLGSAPAFVAAKTLAERVAPADATVLLEGPTGAGKELFAQAIHQASPRAGKPFVAVNCSAFPKDLLESALFGHRQGAFTGAMSDQKGLLEEAKGGTLFLDEIGEMDLGAQAKLLRVLETRQYMRVGDTKPRTADVRVVAATNRRLRQEAAAGHFREDLYFRLAVVTVAVPALSARREDIDQLARHFTQEFATKLRKRIKGLTPEALRRLRHYPWPGNVRELKNVLERAVLLCDDEIGPECLPAEFEPAPADGSDAAQPDDGRRLASVEKRHIRQILAEVGGNKTEAARQLGIGLTTLYRKIQEYGLG